MSIDLYEENQTAITQSNTTAHSRSDWSNLSSVFSSMDLDDNSNEDDFSPDSNGSSDSDNTSLLPLGCIFSQSSLVQIQDCIAHAVILSWINQPSSNLGDKTHRKLKANQWLILFTIFFFLILSKIWSTSTTQNLLNNFYDVVVCTQIVTSYTISIKMPKTFSDHYLQYQKSLHSLFPNAQSHPNHHFAMHIPHLLSF